MQLVQTHRAVHLPPPPTQWPLFYCTSDIFALIHTLTDPLAADSTRTFPQFTEVMKTAAVQTQPWPQFLWITAGILLNFTFNDDDRWGRLIPLWLADFWLLLRQKELSEVMGIKAWAEGKAWFRSRRRNFPSKACRLCSLKVIWWTEMNHLLLSVPPCCI